MYSAETEAYAASVSATGRDWAQRVENLRQTFPGNENAFKAALEKQVYAAHSANQQQQQRQQQPQQQQQQQDAQRQQAYPGGRSYPGQQQAYSAASTPVASPHKSKPSQSDQSALTPGSVGYIPYARDSRPLIPQQRRTGVAPLNIGNGTPTSSHASPVAPPSLGRSSSTAAAIAAANASNNAPRTSSSLNPAAIRGPKPPAPTPLTSSTDPVPPFFPIGTAQAFMTTYPSRLRLGTTLLMQPIAASGQVISANTATAPISSTTAPISSNANANYAPNNNTHASRPSLPEPPGSTLGKRQRARVDYTEKVDIPEVESSSDDDDEDDDDPKPGRAGRVGRKARAANKGSPAPEQTAATGRKRHTKTADVGGGGRSWLGHDPPGELIMVQAARRHVLPWLPEHDLAKVAQNRTVLVPVRIDLDADTFRIRDVFMWNMMERVVTPEVFAKVFCLDADIPYDPWGAQISASIRSQLDEYAAIAELSLLTPEQEAGEQEADLRTIINLDVQIGTLHLVDRIEWDLTSSLTPEDFAGQLCNDLGLGGEAIMIISHAVHEEIIRLKRECLDMGLASRLPSDGGRDKGPKRLDGVWRDYNEAKLYGPHVEILTAEAIDVLESEKERNPRRLKRNDTRWNVQQRERPGRRR